MELCEEDALAIATEWTDRLNEQIPALHFDVSENEQGLAYIRFYVRPEVNYATNNTITYDEWRLLLETFAVWRALTHCRGIGEAEIWRISARVANKLSATVFVGRELCFRSSVIESYFHLKDALQFIVEINFTEPDEVRRDFLPLVNLFENYAQVRKTMSRDEAGWTSKYTATCRHLKQFLDPEQHTNDGAIWVTLQITLTENFALSSTATLAIVLLKIARIMAADEIVCSECPRLVFRDLQITDWRFEALHLSSDFLTKLPVGVNSLDVCIPDEQHSPFYKALVHDALDLEPIHEAPMTILPCFALESPQPTKLKKLSLTLRSALSPRQTILLFSALPYTATLTTLQLDHEWATKPCRLSPVLAAWIAYAALHPKTKESSWRNLSLSGLEIRGQDTLMELRQVDRSSVRPVSISRLAMMTEEKIQNDGGRFRTARVKKGTRVKIQPDKRDSTWVFLNREITLEVCDLADRASAFRCVLLPGFGFGYVFKSGIMSVSDAEVELPLQSAITSFDCEGECSKETTQLLLGAIGENLQMLKMLRLSDSPIYPSVLDDVTQMCRRVRNIEIFKWPLSPESLAALFSHRNSMLESLSLDWERGIVTALARLLGDQGEGDRRVVEKLKSLRLCGEADLKDYDFLNQNTRELEHILQTNKTLEHLILTIRFSDPISKAQIAQLSRLVAYHGEDLTPYSPLRRRLAFLSAQGARGGSRRQLNPDMLANILKFVIPRVSRRVNIYSWSTDLERVYSR